MKRPANEPRIKVYLEDEPYPPPRCYTLNVCWMTPDGFETRYFHGFRWRWLARVTGEIAYVLNAGREGRRDAL